MKKFIKTAATLVLTLVLMMSVAIVASADETGVFTLGAYNESVIALQQKLIDFGYLDGNAARPWGEAGVEALKELQGTLGWDETGNLDQEQLDEILSLSTVIGKNLAVGSSNEWSEWFTPEANAKNKTFNVAVAYLREKNIGDAYTCSLEIEFKDVTANADTEETKFGFRTQGSVDKDWKIGNVWNSKIVKLSGAAEVPADGVYQYTATNEITVKNVNGIQFNLGFRCDYWTSGSFRVRNIKVEKGSVATDWCMAEADIGDGKNMAVGSSNEWSEWFTPEAGKENRTFNPFHAVLGAKNIGDAYTCSLEIEFKDVTAAADTEEEKFGFWTQGAVDKDWKIGNVWNSKIVKLSGDAEAPADGVYQYTATNRITEKNVDGEQFNLGFRCDYWKSGSFRVRNVKVERGTTATEWSPAE